ncbi:recombinase family protein [Peribacillus frigoritolerans]|uniref:recombinase family protein n=1 Tax=Peribacillus frigoritolerans TaxID=450367 RepID=UPI003D03118A
MKVGYARVSTVGQSLESQIEQLIEYGCEIIYMEKESGKKTDRQDLDNARKALRKGDKLVLLKLTAWPVLLGTFIILLLNWKLKEKAIKNVLFKSNSDVFKKGRVLEQIITYL